MHGQLPSTKFHQHPLARAQMHLDRAVSALGDADRTLAEAGAADADRAAIARAQVEIFEQQSWINDELRYAVPRTRPEMPQVPADPIPHASSPMVPPPPVASAIRQLFGAAGAADLETGFGQLVTVQLIEQAGARLIATAPRLTLRQGMELTGRVIDTNGAPWRVAMTCHDAIEQADRMRVTLDVAGVTGDDQRQSVRMGIDTTITLTAAACAHLREGDEVRGQLVDLSRSGLAFAAAADLRAGDRLMFHARLLEGAIEGELRVVSIRPEHGATAAGCWFASLEAGSADVIARVLARHRLRPSTVSYPKLRALFDDASSVDGHDQG
jgi:hypothetical protein